MRFYLKFIRQMFLSFKDQTVNPLSKTTRAFPGRQSRKARRALGKGQFHFGLQKVNFW